MILFVCLKGGILLRKYCPLVLRPRTLLGKCPLRPQSRHLQDLIAEKGEECSQVKAEETELAAVDAVKVSQYPHPHHRERKDPVLPFLLRPLHHPSNPNQTLRRPPVAHCQRTPSAPS
jgi:hypothetical protein